MNSSSQVLRNDNAIVDLYVRSQDADRNRVNPQIHYGYLPRLAVIEITAEWIRDVR